MEKKELMYEGKAKEIFATDNEDVILMHYKDDATAGNGVKHDQFAGKGVLNHTISGIIFDMLEEAGIKTHMIEKLNDTDDLVKKVEIFPLEVIVRNITTGSFCKRLGAKEGVVLAEPIFEISYKNDEYGDPLINEDHAVALGLCTRDEYNTIKSETLKINELLKAFFLRLNLKLVDFKIEFGKTKDMEEPVLLSGTDGCGTKVKLAFVMDKHDTIGIDAVAMCVNDIACSGGEPLFFLDYIACGKNYPEKIATIVKGVAEGCIQSECALVGGETAEHPGLMPVDDYDLAGFAVGVVDKKDIIDGSTIKPGDALVGIASTGVHSNGFSLVRSVFEMTKESLDTYYDELGTTLGEALIAPTKIYVKALKSVKNAGIKVKGCSHITGGGFYENLPRMLPDGVKAVVKKDSYKVPPIFGLIAKAGNVEEKMMYNTFNMGLGMVLAVDPADVEKTIEAINAAGYESYEVGYIAEGEKGAELC